MSKIKDWRGISQELGNQIYEVIESDVSGYGPGTLVRLISGVDDSKVPGYHFNSAYRTVCRLDAERAEFIGIHRQYLKPVSA